MNLVKGISALVLSIVLLVSMAVPALAWAEVDVDTDEDPLTPDEYFTNEPTVAIKVNDMWVESGESDIDVERGEELDIELYIEYSDLIPELNEEYDLGLDPEEELENLEITAKLVYEHGDETTSTSTGLFDLTADRTKKETLTLTVPRDIETGDARLFLVMQDEESISTDSFDVHISGKRHELSIERVLMSPNSVVKAGSYLTVKARVENFGERSEDDILFSAEVEGLEGAYDSELLDDDLGKDDAENTDELYLGIPLCAKAGEYKVRTAISYNNDHDEVVKYNTITVVESASSLCKPVAEAEPKVTVPVAAQTVKAGQSIVLPVTVSNPTSEAKNFVVSLTVGDWASTRFAPSNSVTVAGESTETLYVYVDTKADAAGEKVLGLTVKSGDEVVEQSTLKANVEGKSKDLNLNKLGLRKVLEIGLVVLIVLIVLVGLIIGFNKLKDDDDDFDEEDKSYY